jgi:hypothetical protein
LEIKKLKGKPKIFEWYDAVTHTRIEKQKLKDTADTRQLMEIIKTSGHKIYTDEYGIIICTEDAGDELDITIIPKKWLIK